MRGRAALPPGNPYLMRNSWYSHAGWGPAGTGAAPVSSWTGRYTLREASLQWVPGGPGTTGAGHRRYQGYGQAVLACGTGRVQKIRIDGGRFDVIDELVVPGREGYLPSAAEIVDLVALVDEAGTDERRFLPPLCDMLARTRLTGAALDDGRYGVLDRDGYWYLNVDGAIVKIADRGPDGVETGIEILAARDLGAGHLRGLAMTYDGALVAATADAIVVTDRDLRRVAAYPLDSPLAGHGLCLDARAGIYVLTETGPRKFVRTGRSISADPGHGAWQYRYEDGTRPVAGPALMGFGDDPDRLLVVADAPPGGDSARATVFWRDRVPAGCSRLAGRLPLTTGARTRAPLVFGYRALYVTAPAADRAHPAPLDPALFAFGVSTPALGRAEQVVWNPARRRLERGWSRSMALASGVGPVSTRDETVTLCTVRDGQYTLVPTDWANGDPRGEITLGRTHRLNTLGGRYIPMASGDYYVTGFFGAVRVRRP
ncbi:MAG TPA: hypothetical protein VF054_19635 [Micromonosporaceae bacterium]